MRVLFLITLLFPYCLFAQYQIKGRIIDEKTKDPLAFVNIIVNDERLGTSTDINGYFNFKSPQPITNLKLSYVGYELQNIDVKNRNKLLIKMKQTSFALNEVNVFPGINPAERIIKEVIKNRKINNPEKTLNFKYESYSKMYFSMLLDSSRLYDSENNTDQDSSAQNTINWLKDHYLFMIESITERKYKQPDKSYEKVIATKVSGLKNPSFSLIASQLQSFTFYNPTIKLLENTYLNPISENSIKKYFFLIEDTILNNSDTTFIISYRPRKGKNFDALKGVLYINTDGFAIQNVIAEPFEDDEILSIKIQQQYEKIAGSWFPVQLNSDLIIEPAVEDGIRTIGINQTYIKNVEINPDLSNKDFSNVVTEIDEDAPNKTEAYWESHRNKPLTEKELNTYHSIDSISKAHGFEKKYKAIEVLSSGKIDWGFISFDINRFLNYNNYEGQRVGAGLHTNKKVAKWFSVGGYGAYAFGDKTEKYGGDLNFFINKRNDIELNFSYQKDVVEPGVVNFYDYKIPAFSTAGNRRFFNLDRMNNIEKLEAKLQFRTMRYLKVHLFANQESVEITNNYYYQKRVNSNAVVRDQYYIFNEVGVEFRYAFKEKIVQLMDYNYPIKSKYPILYAKVEQGIKQFSGEYAYTRFTFRAEKKFFIKNLGHPKFYLETGYIHGNVPQHKLNSSLGTFDVNKTINISTENAFETMLPYEFFSSEYFHFHFRHSFGSLLFKSKKFEPEIILTTSIGFGGLSYEGAHGGETFKTMEKGYYESGLVINHILKYYYFTFGAGVFYRYGPYQFEETSDNIAAKLSLGFVIPKKIKK